MVEFSKVSLGFAEFVSKLLHETFDATLSIQQYQLEKFLELEEALNLSTSKFQELYINSEEIEDRESEDVNIKEIEDRENEIFGVILEHKMQVSQKLLDGIAFLKIKEDGIIWNKSLTKKGFVLLRDKVKKILKEERRSEIIEIITQKKKNLIQELINRTDMVKLMIQSGEIRAKLELSNFLEDVVTDKTEKNTRNEKKKKTTNESLPIPMTSKLFELSKLRGIKFREISDLQGEKAIIIDKDTIKNKPATINFMPNVRLIAKPAQSKHSSSEFYSEVTIKFKTI